MAIDRWLLAFQGDKHSGSETGLQQKGQKYIAESGREEELYLNELQEVLYEVDTSFIETVKKLQDEKGFDTKTIYFDNGDLTHGDKHIGGQVSTKMDVQLQIAKGNMKRLFSEIDPDEYYIIEGTGAHNFGEGSGARLLYDYFHYAGKNIYLSKHLKKNFGGKIVDIAHHGPSSGSRTWLKGNSFRYYLRDLLIGEQVDNNVPPDIVVRSHTHEFVKEYVSSGYANRHEMLGFILPPMCWLNGFARQVTKSIPRVSLGGMIVEIIDGKIGRTFEKETVHWFDTRDVFL